MESNISLVLRRYFSTFTSGENTKITEALNQGASAIYQIERTIGQLKEASLEEEPEIEVRKRSMIALAVIAQLEAFLETMIEKPQKPDNAS